MRTVSAALTPELARTNGPEFRVLCIIGGGRFLATESRTIDAQAYAGELLSVSPLHETLDGLGDLTITLADTPTNRAAVQLTALVEVYWWSPGLLLSEADLQFKGEISDPVSIRGGEITFDAVSYAQRHDRLITDILSATDFPGIDPDYIGKVAPVGYGSLTEVPCIPIDAGIITTLVEAIDDVQTDFLITDSLPATGSLQIDEEAISYTTIAAEADPADSKQTRYRVSGCTRNANAAGAVQHSRGAKVAEVKTQYDYVVLNHPVKALRNVRVDGVIQQGTDFVTYTDLNGRAVIRFVTLPTLAREVNLVAADGISLVDDLTIHDGIEVIDDIAIDDPGHTHTSSNQGDFVPTITGTTQAQIADGNYSTQATYAGGFFREYIYHDVGSTANKVPVSITIKVKAAFNIVTTWGSGSVFVLNNLIGQAANFNGAAGYTITKTISVSSWGAITNLFADVSISDGDWMQLYEVEVTNVHWAETNTESSIAGVSKTGSAQKSGTVGRTGGIAKSGTVTLSGNSVADTKIGGQITVDVDAWQDDAAGTITGTPYALIDRQDHVARHALQHYGGALEAEAAAGDFTAQAGDRLAMYLNRAWRVRELLRVVAEQTRSVINYAGGRWYMRRRPGAAPVPDLTLTDALIIREENGASTVSESRTGLQELANRHDYRYGRQPGGEAFAGTGRVEDAASQTSYGLRDTSVDLDFVPDQAQALDVITWRSAREANPNRAVINLQATLAAHAVEPGDILRINNTKTGVDVTGEVIALGPRVLTGRGAGAVPLTIEEA